MTNKTIMKIAAENQTEDIGCAKVNIDDLIEGIKYIKEYAQTKVDESLNDESFKIRVQEATHDLTKATSERILRRNSTKRDIVSQMMEQIFNSPYHLDMLSTEIANKLVLNNSDSLSLKSTEPSVTV